LSGMSLCVRLGKRDMGLLGSILKANACQKRATAALCVLGEQPVRQLPRHVRGHALLCYDVRAAAHVGAVTAVLDTVGMPWADERDATHFQELVIR